MRPGGKHPVPGYGGQFNARQFPERTQRLVCVIIAICRFGMRIVSQVHGDSKQVRGLHS